MKEMDYRITYMIDMGDEGEGSMDVIVSAPSVKEAVEKAEAEYDLGMGIIGVEEAVPRRSK